MQINPIYYAYDMEYVTSIPPMELVSAINSAIEKYGQRNVEFIVDTEREPYSDYDHAVAYLKCKRNMTEAERAMYERLKAQFEGTK